MKFLRLLLRCYFVGKSVRVLWNVSCFRCGTQKNTMWYKISTNYPLKHQVRCRVVNYAITKRSLKSHSVCLSPCPADGALLTESCLIFSAYLEQASGSQFSFCLQESELKIHTALWLYLPVHTQTTIARQRQTTWNRQIFIWTTLQNFLLFMIWKNAEGVEWNMKELSNIVSTKNVHFFMPAGIGIKWGFFSQLIYLHKFLD